MNRKTSKVGSWRIGELAKATGVSTDTLRHYERKGVLRSARSGNGYREYPENALERVRTIRQARPCLPLPRSVLPADSVAARSLSVRRRCRSRALCGGRLPERDRRASSRRAPASRRRRMLADRAPAVRPTDPRLCGHLPGFHDPRTTRQPIGPQPRYKIGGCRS